MKKKKEKKGKVFTKHWGVGKTISVIISSLAFVVGVAILGVYLAGGFEEKIVLPENIFFDTQSNPNFNEETNRIEIAQSDLVNDSFVLVINSTTENITNKNINLSFSYTYTFDNNINDFTDAGLGITDYGNGYISNGVLTIPKTVQFGEPFNVQVNKYDYQYSEQEIVKWIKGGISTITASANLENVGLSKTSLTIAVDTPVYKTETILVNASGEEFAVENNISNIVVEENFYPKTIYYPTESKYVYANKEIEKTTFYQLVNVQNQEIASTIYMENKKVAFYAGDLIEGAMVESFTLVNAKIYQEIEEEIASMEIDISDYENLYNEYLRKYSEICKTDFGIKTSVSFNIVQASIGEFTVSNSGQTFEINEMKGLNIYINQNSQEPSSEFLGVKIYSQNDTEHKYPLNSILQNVALSFLYKENGGIIDPTEDNGFLTVSNAKIQEIDGVKYYLPFFEENQTDKNLGVWNLQVSSGNIGKVIEVKVSLIIEGENGTYSLFSDKNGVVQHSLNLNVVEHIEDEIAWTNSEDKNISLTYEDGSSEPIPSEIDLAGATIIPENNIYKTIRYFAYFENINSIEEQESKDIILKMFNSMANLSRAGMYQTSSGDKFLIPLTITNDKLYVQDAGKFQLYFATIDESKTTSSYYSIVKIVEYPIDITVEKTLYTNSLLSANINYVTSDGTEEEIIDLKNLPTSTDSVNKDKLKIYIKINSDSVNVFKEKFENYLIELKIYSAESDITDYLLIENTEFYVNEEGENFLIYTLVANETYTTDEDLVITNVEILYFENEDKNVFWSFNDIFNGGSLLLYTPSAQSVEFISRNNDYENLINNNINVKQTLNTNGAFDLSIIVGGVIDDITGQITGGTEYNTVDAFLAIFGVKVVDQKGNETTLSQSWSFVSDNPILQVSENGKSITFLNGVAQGVSLTAVCGEQETSNNIVFDIDSEGITSIQVDTSIDPETNDMQKLEEVVTSTNIQKYGEKDQTITLKNAEGQNAQEILEFYVQDGKYQNISFKFSPIYLAGRSSEELENLYGEGGMININGSNHTATVENLQNLTINTLSFNKNFATDHNIIFIVSDDTGSVNFTLTLNILNNISITATSQYDNIYANTEIDISSDSNVNNQVDNQELYSLIGGVYEGKTFYINQSGNEYILEETNNNAVGEIYQGKIKFYHFFNVESKQINVIFQPEGTNDYAAKQTITFNVLRNIQISNFKIDGNLNKNLSVFDSLTKAFNNYFAVTDVYGNSASAINIEYILNNTGNIQNYIEISNTDNSQFTLKNNLRYNYGVTSLVQKVIVKVYGNSINDYYSKELELEIILPEEFFNDFAECFTYDEINSPSIQIAGNNNYSYIVFESGKSYNISTYNGYTITPSQKDGDKNLSQYYTVLSKTIIYQNNTNDLLLGLNNSDVYTLVNLQSQTGGRTITIAMPTIISRIGTQFVSYTDGTTDNQSLANALKTVDELLQDNIYKTITAGQTYGLICGKEYQNVISNLNILHNSSDAVLTIKEQPISSIDISQLPTSLFKYYDVENGTITLNHLSSYYQNAYLGISLTLSLGAGNVIFNYLFKVEPDVVVEKPNYPYNGNAEYIESSSSIIDIYLNSPFGEDTLKNDETRFNIKPYTIDGTQILSESYLSGLTYADSIKYVKVYNSSTGQEQVFESANDWNNYIYFNFLQNSSNEDFLRISLKTGETIEFVLTRNYIGASDINNLAVVGGTIDYKFVINKKTNYSIRVDQSTQIQQNGIFEWTLNNWQEQTINSEVTQSSTRSESKNIYLIENAVAGNVNTGTPKYNTLKFNLNDLQGADISVEGNTTTLNYDDKTFTFTYNSGDASFNVTYPSYLEKDYVFEGTLYTEYGKVATIEFTFKADATYEIKETSFDGGKAISLNDIFTIKTSGSESSVNLTDFKIVSSEISAFIQKDGLNLKLASVVEDVVGDITFEVYWGDGLSYTFTIENFIIGKNIIVEDQTIDNIIAGSEVTRDFVSSATNGDVTYSWNTNSLVITTETQTGENENSFAVTTNQVAANTEITIPVTITITPNFAETETRDVITTTSKTILVTLKIYPSVQLEPNYPIPSTEELTVEYIENNTTFDDFDTNFLKENAVFAEAHRIGVKYADLTSNVIDYNENVPEGFSINKQVVIKSLTNAVVKQNNEALVINDEIDLEGNVTFTRGTAGGVSQVVLTIYYNNVKVDYTIQILDSAFNVVINTASNNTTANENGQYENIYVDKTNPKNLFAENRMLKANILSGASAGDYYIFFKDKEDGTILKEAKVLNLSEEFINLNLNKVLYFDLGIVDLTKDISSYNIFMWTDELYQKAVEEKGTQEIFDYLYANYAESNLFTKFFTNYSLTSRVVLTYNGIEVDYAKYEEDLKYTTESNQDNSLSTPYNISTGSIGNINKDITAFVWTYSNGGNITPKTYSIQYAYMPEIDITVDTIAGSNGGYITVEAKQSVNLIEAFGIRRATTKELLQKDEILNNTDLTIKLEVADNSNQVVDSDNYKYLSISAVTSNINNSNRIFDYQIRGDGADNDGNRVNLTFTYQIGEFTKTFNLQVEVVNDYVFNFGGNTNLSTESDGTVSNKANPLVISKNNISTTDATIYNDIVLAGASEDAFLSIKHKNDMTDELSVLAFNYKIEEDKTIDDTTYNIEGNVDSKLNLEGNDWSIPVGSTNLWNWNKTNNQDSLILSQVKVVNFGSQYYRLEATDGYGFVFYLYFTISSGNADPMIYTSSGSSTLSLTEGETVAFGANYELLTITEKNGNLTINSANKEPEGFIGENKGKLIQIQNLEAWAFENNYYNDSSSFIEGKYFGGSDELIPENEYKIINTVEGKQNVVGIFDKTIGESQTEKVYYILNDENAQKYLKLPNLGKIQISSIKYYYNNQLVGEDNNINKSISTKGNANLNHVNGDIYKSANACSFTLPKVTDTSIFGTSNSVTLNMVVTLKYTESADNVEYYDMTTEIVLNKTSSVTKIKDLVADNQSFNLKDYITVTENGAEVVNYAIYDDTLGIVVGARETATFTLSYNENNKEVSIYNSEPYERIVYRSLSEIFETVLKENDNITIISTNGKGTFYYGGNEITNNQITISEITNDTLRVSNYQQIANSGMTTVAQYYIVNVNGKLYRYTHNFNLTGTFVSIEKGYLDYNYTLPNNIATDIPLSVWAENITYTQVVNGEKVSGNLLQDYLINDICNLYFVITSDDSTGGTGLATIDPNTGAIQLKSGFDENHYATVQIYQKVSGVQGNYSDTDTTQMQLLGTVLLKIKNN